MNHHLYWAIPLLVSVVCTVWLIVQARRGRSPSGVRIDWEAYRRVQVDYEKDREIKRRIRRLLSSN